MTRFGWVVGTLLSLCGSASAQWQVPLGDFPIGRGAGTGFDSVSGKGVLTGTLSAKTTTYALQTTDCGKIISLGGTAFYELTIGAASGFAATCTIQVENTDSGRGKLISPNGLTSFILWPKQKATINNNANVWVVDRPNRWRLSASTTINVNGSSGSNTNNDCLGTGAGACQTIQGGVNLVCGNLDLAQQQLIVQVADGTYSESVLLCEPVGAVPGGYLTQALTIRGNIGTNNVVVHGNGYAFAAVNIHSGWLIEGFRIYANNSGFGILSDARSILYSGSNNFGDGVNSNMTAFLAASYGGFLESVQGSAGAPAWGITIGAGQAIYADAGANVLISAGPTVTCVGAPPFNFFASANNLSLITAVGITFSGCGSATGPRFASQWNSLVNTEGGGSNYFPGDMAGGTSNGGLYK